MTELSPLLDLADLAVARSEGAVSSESRLELARVVKRARGKLGYVGEVLVVAFAGGTGSGKSSLINAIIGDTVAPVGVVRPTTDKAMAVVPRGRMSSYARLLSDLDVPSRVESKAVESTILVDLPDFDSTAKAHKHIVEAVLPIVDAVVWVLDPEKYADNVVHEEFLAKLVPYKRQFVFVLNHVDRLGDDATVVASDLKRLLESDGFAEPDVVRTVAHGPDTDVSDLIASLSDRLDTKRTVISKLAIDLRIAANDGWKASRATSDSGVGEASVDEIGLAAATFVSLGVEAMGVLNP